MSIKEIFESVQYLVDNQGKETAVQLDWTTWQTVRQILEDLTEDYHLGQLMIEVEYDERLSGDSAYQAYQAYLTKSQ